MAVQPGAHMPGQVRVEIEPFHDRCAVGCQWLDIRYRDQARQRPHAQQEERGDKNGSPQAACPTKVVTRQHCPHIVQRAATKRRIGRSPGQPSQGGGELLITLVDAETPIAWI